MLTRPINLKPKKSRKWTEADLARVKSLLLAGRSAEDVAKALDRSANAIRIQATKLRLSASSDLRRRNMRNEALQGRQAR